MDIYSIDKSRLLREKYPGYRPIILIGDNLIKTKLLLRTDMTICNLMTYIRFHNKLNHFEAHYLFCNSVLLIQNQTVSEVFSNYSNDNGFLYITVKKENTFG